MRKAWRFAAGAGIALIGSVLSFAVTANDVLAPRQAAAWWPWSAEAAGRIASESLASSPTRNTAAAAVPLAIAALNRSPVEARAARALGFARDMQNDSAGAGRAIRYAETLSRRDPAAQLWLIEDAVRRNDIPEALRHYDRALRTSIETRTTLYPVLVNAATDPAIRGPLIGVLRERPGWWRDFSFTLVDQGKDARTIREVVGSLALQPDDGPQRALLENTLGKLVALGDFAGAHAIYKRASGHPARLINDGSFAHTPVLRPFDWALQEDGDASAYIQARPDAPAGNALFLSVADGAGGTPARQLLLLSPGRYAVQAVAGGGAADPVSRPRLTITCANGSRSLGEARAPGGRSGRRFGFEVAVPPGCAAQWLALTVDPGAHDAANAPWVTDVAVTPR